MLMNRKMTVSTYVSIPEESLETNTALHTDSINSFLACSVSCCVNSRFAGIFTDSEKSILQRRTERRKIKIVFGI